jgi:hypothetical protein
VFSGALTLFTDTGAAYVPARWNVDSASATTHQVMEEFVRTKLGPEIQTIFRHDARFVTHDICTLWTEHLLISFTVGCGAGALATIAAYTLCIMLGAPTLMFTVIACTGASVLPLLMMFFVGARVVMVQCLQRRVLRFGDVVVVGGCLL